MDLEKLSTDANGSPSSSSTIKACLLLLLLNDDDDGDDDCIRKAGDWNADANWTVAAAAISASFFAMVRKTPKTKFLGRQSVLLDILK